MPVMPWEKTITCPYNPSHQITVEKIQWHLVKCAKNHPGSNLVVCPFNSAHHVPRPELGYHLNICPDRKMVEKEMYRAGQDRPGSAPKASIPLPPSAPMPPSEEDWEAEATVVTSYDPAAAARKKNVLRNLQGATPSQRKEFRAEEARRHELLQAKKLPAPAAAAEAPRESVARGALRRPTLVSEPAGEGARLATGLVRPSVLAAHLGRGAAPPAARTQLRRPGSFLAPGSLASAAGSQAGGGSLDTTRDTLDQAITAVGRIALGRGRRVEGAPQPLRRPSLAPPAY